MKIADWYPIEEGKYNIELNINKFEQLYDKRDPNPYRLKDLDDDIVEYLTSSYFELGNNKLGKIKIYHQDNLTPEDEQEMRSAFHEYFNYRTNLTQFKIDQILKAGFYSLGIGLIFLTLTIVSSKYLKLHDQVLTSFLKELLLLTGWVSMWKPINIFLYEWWPFLSNKRMYEKLSSVKVEIIKKELE